MMDAEQKRVKRLPRETQRQYLKNWIRHAAIVRIYANSRNWSLGRACAMHSSPTMIDEPRLRIESAEIEPMLAELRDLVAPTAWQRVEEVLGRLVRLYGAGLERALTHARAAGAVEPFFDELVGEDALLASLLVLHGLHPQPTAERVRRAIDHIADVLGYDEGDIVVLEIGRGVVKLRAKTPPGGSLAARAFAGAIRHAIEAAAPEVDVVEIAGLD